MSGNRIVKLIVMAAVTVISTLTGPSPAFCHPQQNESREIMLREQLVSFLQNGGSIESIPSSHALYPLREMPSVAMFSYLLLRQDPGMLERFYPRINDLVMARISADLTLENGFLPGDGMGSARGIILMSPFPNALAALELRALYLIALAAGRYEDALELRTWSREFSQAVVKTFYDHTNDSFFPVSEEGYYLIAHSPELLLPMTADEVLGETARTRISNRLMYKMDGVSTGNRYGAEIRNSPSHSSLVRALLSTIDRFPTDRLDAMMVTPGRGDGSGSTAPARNSWIEFWDRRPSRCEALFPEWDCISPLILFSLFTERESLLEEKNLRSLKEDLEKLTAALSSDSAGLETHAASIRLVNSLLARMSDFSSSLDSGERLWKFLDEAKWNRLSPRSKKLLTAACKDAISGLMSAKAALTRIFMRSSGIVAEIHMPDRSVPSGRGIDFDISIKSAETPLGIEQVFLQVSGTRWKLTDGPEKILLGPGEKRMGWKRTLVLPPGTDPGIVPVPLFVDFLCEGKRIELHMLESVTLTMGYDVSLSFANGRKLEGDKGLPVNITIRHQAGNIIQGMVEGVFLKGIHCTPELPARFALKDGSVLTELPLEIGFAESLSPGNYPLTLSVSLDGNSIASFDEVLVRPLEWIHIGPLTNRRWALEEALELQDNLSGIYVTPDGNELKWRKVAPGACGGDGAVLPDRLYGSKPDQCMILYTAISMRSSEKVRWNLESGNVVSLWINAAPVLNSEHGETPQSGITVLKKGRNAVLIAASWSDSAAPVLFSMSDEAGLPVAGMGNDIGSILETYAISLDSPPEKNPGAFSGDQPREVTLELDMPDAAEVSVIGEFNNWTPDSDPMRKKGAGRWSVTLLLPRGIYQYKFLVDRKTKIIDPSNDNNEPDGFGGLNSVLAVK